MLPGLQRLRLVPCPTGMDAMDTEDEPWARNVRRRVEALRVTTPELPHDLVRTVLAAIDTGDKLEVCRMASAWCAANRSHRQACLDAGPLLVGYADSRRLHDRRAHARSERRARQLQRAVQPHQRLPGGAAHAAGHHP